jgi:hypothetical protein
MLNSTTVQHPRLGIDASRWAACNQGVVRGACQHRPWCHAARGIAEHMGLLRHKKRSERRVRRQRPTALKWGQRPEIIARRFGGA